MTLDSCVNVTCSDNKTCNLDQNGIPHCIPCGRQCSVSNREEQVCGDNGVTYQSRCDLEHTSCITGSAIRVAYLGRCIGKCQGEV